MFNKILFLFSLIFSFCAVAQNIRFSPDDQDLYLATRFLQTSFEDKKDNFVVSPLSVYAATTLLANGAKNETLTELRNILGNRDWEGNLHLNLGAVNQKLFSYMDKKSQFEINNSIWGDDFKTEYQEKMVNDLLSETKPLPQNTTIIDNWIREKTKGRIQNMLGNNPTKEGELFLVNTVYFKDEWQNPFEEHGTRIADFHSLDGDLDKVDMMIAGGMIDYYQDGKIQAVRLPYKNGDVMQIFLPKEGVDFNSFIQNLSAGDLYLRYYKVPVTLRVPKFNLEYKITDMPKFFKKWGIQTIFDSRIANLSELSDKPKYVSKIIHQANIGVNEKGTEASAATVFVAVDGAMLLSSLSRKDWTIPFIADRPFIFMINNGDFIGVYVKGSSELYKERQKREEKHKKEQEKWEKKHKSPEPELIFNDRVKPIVDEVMHME